MEKKQYKYAKAPVSEVILGVTSKERALSTENIFELREIIKADFPLVEVVSPLADEVLLEFKLINKIDPNITGPIMYRFRSSDRAWLLQVQGNKVYLNWIRDDTKEVGYYPGYRNISEKFYKVLADVSRLVGKPIESNLLYFDLTYHDRFEWGEYISNISEIDKILNFSTPRLSIQSGFNNVFSKFTFPISELGGYGILDINTGTSIKNTQLLKFENVIRGVRPDVKSWFDSANDLQNKNFEDIFKKEVLKTWEK